MTPFPLQDSSADPTPSLAGRYLAVRLGPNRSGIRLWTVREIVRFAPLTPVPGQPAYVRGVINLRGKVIPVIDLRLRFGLPCRADEGRTCIVIVQPRMTSAASRPTGLIVDEVEAVLEFTDSMIHPAPDFGDAGTHPFAAGMACSGDDVTALLDIERVLGIDPSAGASATCA